MSYADLSAAIVEQAVKDMLFFAKKILVEDFKDFNELSCYYREFFDAYNFFCVDHCEKYYPYIRGDVIMEGLKERGVNVEHIKQTIQNVYEAEKIRVHKA